MPRSISLVVLVVLSLGASALVLGSQTEPKRRPAPPTAIEAAGAPASTAASAAALTPGRQLAEPHPLLSRFHGPSLRAAALKEGRGPAEALASADFDEDGVPDLVVAHSGAEGAGTIALHRGNIDALYPNEPAAKARRAGGTFVDAPFLPDVSVFDTPESAEFIGAGDFDADGHRDAVVARRGGTALFWHRGDGKGSLSEARKVTVPGAITALAFGDVNRRDGLEDIVVAVEAGSGGSLLVFEGPMGALTSEPEEIPLAERPNAIALGRLDGDGFADLAIASGKTLMVIPGRDRGLYMNASRRTRVASPELLTAALPFPVRSLVLGDFDSTPGMEIALLDSSRRLAVVAAQDLLTALVTAAPLPLEPADIGGDPPNGASATLIKARVSAEPGDDLLLLGRERSGILARHDAGDGPARNRPLARDLGAATAALGMRLGPPALHGLVLLIEGEATPLVADIAPPPPAAVRNTLDSGPNSLRQAILDANGNPGLDTIRFDILGPGPHIITLASPLPEITEATVIDGTSEPDYVTTPVVRLEGNMTTDHILRVSGGGSTIKGLSIVRQAGDGVRAAILLSGAGGNIVERNYIGTNAAGTAAGPSHGSGITVTSPDNLIGGTTVEARNIISGNDFDGILVQGAGAYNNTVQGNTIGLDVNGTALVPNFIGIELHHADTCTIGGLEAGARNVVTNPTDGMLLGPLAVSVLVQGNYVGTNAAGTAAFGTTGYGINISDSSYVTVGDFSGNGRNVVAGHSFGGIRITTVTGEALYNLVVGNHVGIAASGTTALGNALGIEVDTGPDNFIGSTLTSGRNVVSGNAVGIAIGGVGGNDVTGNYIGLSPTGLAAIPNGTGIFIGSSGNRIGGPDPGDGNVISGNTGIGINITGLSADGNLVQSNRIGTDPAGMLAFGNDTGVAIGSGAGLNTIGGVLGETGNLISGNYEGIRVGVGSESVDIQGNLIGTNLAGTAAIPNTVGIFSQGESVLIGGSVPSERNVISGNATHGIDIRSLGAYVWGNLIGTTIDGSGALGNGGSGVRAEVLTVSPPPLSEIGDTGTGKPNVIAHNGAAGVALISGGPIPIRGNVMASNGGLGIDLGGDGVTLNDPGDGDAGPNDRQNFPVLNVARALAGTLTVAGALDSVPGQTFTIDLYTTLVCDPLGHGEGATLIGTTTTTTDGSGSGSFSLTVGGSFAAGDVVTATATGLGRTSEFSACRTVTGTAPAAVGGLMFSATDMLGWDAAPGADFYNVYIGSVSTQAGLVTPISDSCQAAQIPQTGGTLPPGSNPPPGQMIWFLVTAENQYGEGPLQPATSGPRTLDSTGFCGESCAHDMCGTGGALDPACTLCASIVCAKDPHCCNPQNGTWDFQCVQQVRTVCRSMQCAESQGQCPHSLCDPGGGPLSPGCDTPPLAVSCTAAVCQADPHCCQQAWDEACIASMATVCGYSCI